MNEICVWIRIKSNHTDPVSTWLNPLAGLDRSISHILWAFAFSRSNIKNHTRRVLALLWIHPPTNPALSQTFEAIFLWRRESTNVIRCSDWTIAIWNAVWRCLLMRIRNAPVSTSRNWIIGDPRGCPITLISHYEPISLNKMLTIVDLQTLWIFAIA